MKREKTEVTDAGGRFISMEEANRRWEAIKQRSETFYGSSERCSVWSMYDDNNLNRKLFTGAHSECVAAIEHLINERNWPLDLLTIIYDDSGRHASFAVKVRT